MGTVYDYLKGLNKNAFNVLNPFSDTGFSQEELQAREEEFSNPSYMWNSYYLQRDKMEETLDRINTIKKMKELQINLKETRLKILNKDTVETEETKKMFEEYDKELEALEFQKKIQIASLNYAQKNLGGIQKIVTAPLYDVLVDAANPTDLGDLISVGRIGVAAAGATVGAAVASGTATAGLGTVGGMVATEAAMSIPDTALDVARIEDETGEDVEFGEIAKLYGTNVAGGLIMNGVMTGAGYAFGKIFQKVKGRVNKAGASAMNSPNASSMADDVTPNPKMSDAPVEALKQALGEETGEQMADIIKPTQAAKFDSFSSTDDGIMSVTVDMGTTTPTERKIMNLTLSDFKEKNKMKDIPEGEFLNLPNAKELIQEEMVKKSNKVMLDFSHMIGMYARNFANVAQDIEGQFKNKRAKDFIKNDSLFVKEWVNSISILKEQTAEKLSKQVNLNISARGSELGINNYVDFVKFSQQNGVDIFKAMYTGIIPEDLPPAYKEVFGYINDLTYKYSIEVNPREVFQENDDLINFANSFGLEGLFVGMDYTPSDWEYESLGVPMMINPKLTKRKAMEMLDKVRTDLKEKLTGKVDLRKVVEDYSEEELVDFDDALTDILSENISQSRGNIVDKLRKYGLNKRQARSLYSIFNKARNSTAIDTTGLELVDTIVKDFNKRETIKNRLFNFIPKNQVIANESLFMVTKLDEDPNINRTFKVFGTKEEVEANRKFTKEELDRRDKIVEMTSKYLGGNINPRVEKAFWGFDLPLAQGRTKTVDIRTTDITELADAYWKKNGTLKTDWRELSEQDKVKFLDEVATKFYNRLVTRVGEFARQQTGISDVTTYVDSMLTKWNIPKGTIDIRINENAEKFQGYVKRRDKILVLDFPSDVSPDLKLGVARHELQHIYDDVILGAFDDPSFRTRFKNKPTVEDKEIFSRINKGQPVTIREFLGSFYDNHFYSPVNDNFENSYLAAAAREKFNTRTPYEKTQDFLSLLKATTQGRVKERTKVKDIFRFLEGAEDIPDYLDEDFYQDFAIKSFINPEDMFDYTNFLADTGNNKIQNVTANYSKIISRMATEEQGFSVNTLLNQLNSSKIRSDLIKSGVDVDKLDNTNFSNVITSVREGVRERFFQTGSRDFDPLSPSSLASSAVASALIGTRQFVEATVSPVAAGISHILNGGNVTEAAMMTIKNYPMAYKNYFKSYVYGAGTVAENIGDFFNANINAMTQTLLNKQFEQTFTLHLADTLHKIGDIKNSDISLYDAKLFGDFVTQMSILNSGGNPESFLGRMARIFNTSLHGNKADDIQLQAIAQSVAKSEFNKMLGVSSISQLNQIQKQMYSMSGFTNENFKEWQKFARKVVEKKGMDFSSEDFSLKMMLAQGEGAVDIMGMSRRTSNTPRNPFLYMCQTMFNAALLSLQKLRATSVNGLSVDHMDTNTIAKLMAVAAIGTIGVIGITPKQQVEKLVFGNKTTLDDLDSAYEKFEEDPVKGSYEIATTLLDAAAQQTPLAYTVSPSSNGLGVLGAGYSLVDRNIYDFSKGEARSPWLTLSLFAAPIVSSRVLTLSRRFNSDGGTSTPINKAQLKKQLANDIETYLPYSYKSTSKKLRKQQRMNEFSVWGK